MNPTYSDWLRAAVRSWETKLSELRRVEAAYGDLDVLYDEDELEEVISELTYTSADARENRPNPSRLEINGNFRNNLASYKTAVNKYIQFRRNAESVAGQAVLKKPDSEADDAVTFSLERDMQQALRQNIEQLEPGLKIADGGLEHTVSSGRIDILGRDASGRAVVVELKAVTARRDALGQIASYMADIQEKEGESAEVRGLLVAPDFDPKLVSAARMLPGLSLICYAIRFDFAPV